MSPTDTGPAARRDPTLLVVLGALVVLIVVALIVVFTRGQPAPPDPGTPAGVVQRYSTAVLAGDEELAATYLSPGALADCDGNSSFLSEDLRVTLRGTTERDTTADVRVTLVTSSGGGLFGPSEYQSDDSFDLVRVDGDWLIDQAPWQLTVCPGDAGDRP
ncbi:hypothetical protein K2F54_12800 [Cryobacterium sp. 1639]|uniref:hypothetical protein n=1 Tax=Cryobacterium inferilacus TaxID=2866629 RepID=UPI001C72B2CE|nr:hypothetical protein [Cryobacterium sp. 1639]MBX0300854.1 hypothetical protein [Cryobacterium sp. 1639]